MLSIYPACFFKETTGYSVIFPDLENGLLSTCGENLEDAMSMAIDCLAGYLYDCEKDGDTIPPASNLSDVNLMEIGQNTYDNETDLKKNINFSQVLQEALLVKLKSM